MKNTYCGLFGGRTGIVRKEDGGENGLIKRLFKQPFTFQNNGRQYISPFALKRV
jgi:hypothetical protein